MRLETHEGLLADPAAIEDVARAVTSLTQVGEAYVILAETSDDETYVKAAGTVGDGCAGEHYRIDRRVTAVELERLLVQYLRGEPS